jgi:hypothetical protein
VREGEDFARSNKFLNSIEMDATPEEGIERTRGTLLTPNLDRKSSHFEISL